MKQKATRILSGLSPDEKLRRRLAVLEGIARGERAIGQGRVMTHAQAKKRLARWLS